MPNTNWSNLSHLQIGRYGEYFAKMEFSSFGFDVYTSEVDDHGVDFIAKNKSGIFYEVQVKTIFKSNYIYIRKSDIVVDDNHLLCVIKLVNNELPACYVFPSSVFENPDGYTFKSRDYSGFKSQPEYGVYFKRKEVPEILKEYQIETFLNKIII